MLKRFTVPLIALNITVCANCCLAKQSNINEQGRQHQEAVIAVASVLDEDHMIVRDNSLKLSKIHDHIVASGSVSDSDLNWVLNLLAHPEDKDNAYLANVHVVVALYGLKQPTVSQQEKILKAVTPLLSTDFPHDQFGLSKVYGVHLLQKLHNKNAVPYLIPLLHDRNPDVQNHARLALTSLGYRS